MIHDLCPFLQEMISCGLVIKHVHTNIYMSYFGRLWRYGRLKCVTEGKKGKVCPCTGRTAHRGSRGIALPFHDHSTRRGLVVSFKPQPLFTPGKNPVPIVQEAGWAPGPVWTGVENLAPTGIRSPDRPARSQSLYCVRYPAHTT